MDIRSAETAMRRAVKRLAHAARMRDEAPSPKARARHERRQRNAERAHADAVWFFEQLALADPD